MSTFFHSVIHSVFQTSMYHLVPVHASLFFPSKVDIEVVFERENSINFELIEKSVEM